MTSTNHEKGAWVLGASSGIGAALAGALLAQGWRVLATSRDPSRLDGLGASSGNSRLEKEALDLEDLDALPRYLDALMRRHGAPDALISCAGFGLLGALEEASYSQIRRLIDVDLTAQIFLARALIPAMKRRGSGDLIFLGSEAALHGKRRGSLYCAAKFGLRGLAQALREECASSGVRVAIVHPGPVRTPFFEDLEIEPGPRPENALEPEDVAASICHILASPPHAVIDEIVLSPRVAQVRRRRGASGNKVRSRDQTQGGSADPRAGRA